MKKKVPHVLQGAHDNKKVLMIIGAVGAIFCLIVFMWTHHTHKVDDQILATWQTAIAKKQNDIEVKKAANNRAVKKANQAITGYDMSKANKDKGAAIDLFRQCTTWDNGQEYRKIRQDIMKEYKLKANSSFMTTFLPPLVQQGMRIGNDGHNEIDSDHLNMKFVDLDPYITDISGSTYDYFAIVTVQSKDKKGAVATGNFAVRYRVDGKQQISNLSASYVGTDNDD